MQVRNLGILVSCQLISATGMFAMVTLGGIIGASLAPSAAFATLPLSMMVVAVAATTIPASMLMRRLGRRRGFMIASIAASLACLVALLALLRSSFALFITATMLFGTNVAFTHQYLGAIGGAFLGKELATRGQAWLDAVPYGGTMLALSVFFLLQATLFTALAPVREHEDPETRAAERSLRDIVRQPLFMVAVLGGIVSYGVMTLIMTATPLSMHLTDGYSLEQTGSVIRAHVLAMYLPSPAMSAPRSPASANRPATRPKTPMTKTQRTRMSHATSAGAQSSGWR